MARTVANAWVLSLAVMIPVLCLLAEIFSERDLSLGGADAADARWATACLVGFVAAWTACLASALAFRRHLNTAVAVVTWPILTVTGLAACVFLIALCIVTIL